MIKISMLFVLLTLLSLSSCKKTYTCTCTFKTYDTNHILENKTKKEATTACNEMNSNWEDSEGLCKLSK